MLPDRVSNPGPLTYESGALSIALRGPARSSLYFFLNDVLFHPYPHNHFLTFPSLGSNSIGCRILFMET